jgi:hypothetical protein
MAARVNFLKLHNTESDYRDRILAQGIIAALRLGPIKQADLYALSLRPWFELKPALRLLRARGEIIRTGSGVRSNPYVYSLAYSAAYSEQLEKEVER